MKDYNVKKNHAIQQMKILGDLKKPLTLKSKSTSHIFRERKKSNTIDLRHFNQIINIDPKSKTAEVEGMIRFYDLSKETLKYGLIPAVVPELRGITVGGTIVGLGLESASFKYGMVPEIIEEVELLTSEGKIITCSPKKHSDLFNMLPNSWGTLGYVLKCKIKLIPAKKFVHIEYLRFLSAQDYFNALKKEIEANKADFLDGVIFSETEFVIVKGTFSNELTTTDAKLLNLRDTIYYKHIRDACNQGCYLTTFDYLWRWDVDTFWSTDKMNTFVILQNPLVRKLVGWYFLRSDHIVQLRQLREKMKKTLLKFSLITKRKTEQIIQDVLLDIDGCAEFMSWYFKNIKIFPVWICPINNKGSKSGKFPLHKTLGDISVDIGFYYDKVLEGGTKSNHYNEIVEKKMKKMGATKGLYSTSFYSKKEFWSLYDKKAYDQLKKKYDPKNVFPNLYEKAVGTRTL